jgi:hypothetical protein
MQIRKIVDTVISRLPILGDTASSNETSNNPILNAIDDTVVLSDLKAVPFILENTLTYCLNATRRKLVELKGRLRRQVQFSEFCPIQITMEIVPRDVPDASNEPDYFMQFVISFGVLKSADPSLVQTLIDDGIQSVNDQIPNLKPQFDVRIQSALDDIKRRRYLHERLNTSSSDHIVYAVSHPPAPPAADPMPSAIPKVSPPQPTRQSTILMTAKQMLDSCGGSLNLLEITIPHSNSSHELKSGGDINVLVLNIPCHLRSEFTPRYDEVTGKLHFEQVRGKFDFGILVTDSDLSEYAQRMFLECGVKCCRITRDNQLPHYDNYTAIITDSLATYADIRVKGFRGKVIVMSAAAVYIDGNPSNRSCDYVLPVPCQLTDVQELIRSLYYSDQHLSASRIPDLLSLLIRMEETLRSYSSVPFVYFVTQLIGGMKYFFASLFEDFHEMLHWLQMRAETRLEKEREKNEIYQLGKQYDMVYRWFSHTFKTDVESMSPPPCPRPHLPPCL